MALGGGGFDPIWNDYHLDESGFSRPRYHWIEEGSDEDFLRNIMESDLAKIWDAIGPTSLDLYGTYSPGMAVARGHEPEAAANFPLYGTYAPYPVLGVIGDAQIGVYVHQGDLTAYENPLLMMLLARPEMEGCEEENYPAVSQAA